MFSLAAHPAGVRVVGEGWEVMSGRCGVRVGDDGWKVGSEVDGRVAGGE